MNISFEYPFLYFDGFGIKPSLIILIVFIIISVILAICGIKKKEFFYKLDFSNKNVEDKNKKVISVFVYIMLIPLYIFQPSLSSQATFLNDIANTYLSYETLVCTIFLILTLGCVFIQKNKYKYLSFINNTVEIVLFISISMTIFARQIWIFKYGNIICYLFIGFFYMILIICEVKPYPEKDIRSNTKYFQPIESFNDLFLARQIQAEEIIKIIKSSSNDPLSLCISGKWGEGKSSLVKGTIERLKNDTENHYEFIYIDALEIDTISSLFKYLFAQIKYCLKERGVYVGIASEYRKFIKASMGIITNDVLATLLDNKLLSISDDYRAQKDDLEELVSKSLGNDKIIVVVDDIERCDVKKAKQFIFFIKEVATFQNCVAIFVTDYNHLTEISLEGSDDGIAEANKKDFIFYEKFFNYRINLSKILIEESMPFYEKNEFLKRDINYTTFHKPSETFQILNNRFIINITKAEQHKTQKDMENYKKEKISSLQNLQKLFEALLQNARTLGKFYHTFSRYSSIINDTFSDDAIKDRKDEVINYFNKIHLSEILFILSYIEACIPFEFESIKVNGINNYFESLHDKAKENEYHALIEALGEDYFFDHPILSISSSYLQIDATKFIQALLINNNDMINLVNNYTSQEQEWFEAIDNNEIYKLEESWVDVINSILRTFAFTNPSQGKEYINKIFLHINEKIACHDWDPNTPYRIFDSSLRNEHWFSGKLYVMKDFYTSFCNTSKVQNISSSSFKWTGLFSDEYIYDRFDAITKILFYLANDPQDELVIKDAKENLLNRQSCIETKINGFLQSISKLNQLEWLTIKENNTSEVLEELGNRLEIFLKDRDLLKYDDVLEDINSMQQSISDMMYFNKILKFTENYSSINAQFNIKYINPEDLNSAIQYFKEAFKHSDNINMDFKLRDNFSTFFDFIKNEEKVILSANQIDDLHNLVTIYLKSTGHNTMFFRKVLMDYSWVHFT